MRSTGERSAWGFEYRIGPDFFSLLDEHANGPGDGYALNDAGMALVHKMLAMRDKLEQDLRGHFVFPELHMPVEGAGRPTLALLNELSRFLGDTGHTPAEVAKLLPDQSGDKGRVDRARGRMRPQPDKP